MCLNLESFGRGISDGGVDGADIVGERCRVAEPDRDSRKTGMSKVREM